MKQISLIINQKEHKLRLGRIFAIGFAVMVVLGGLWLGYNQPSDQKAKLQGSTPLGVLANAQSNFVSGLQTLNPLADKVSLLKKDGNLTSILVVGVDSRKVAIQNDQFVNTHPQGQAGTRNTDTIMQIVYDYDTKRLYFFSIPRDMGVNVRLDCLKFNGSLHWVYDKAENAKCPGGGVSVLQQTVENITGIKVNYHVFISLDAFEEFVNTIGEKNSKGVTGIYLDNPSPVYEVYPINDVGWKNVYFPKGHIFLDSLSALEYVRSRHITTDFGRARRQQIFLEAVRERLLSADILLDPQKILNLIDLYRQKVLFSEPSFGEILEAIPIIQSIQTDQIRNYVLDPEFGGKHEALIDKQPNGRVGPYYMTPTAWKKCPGDEFCKVKEYIRSELLKP